MIKHAMAALGLTLVAATVRADGDNYISPTDDRMRISLGGVHVSSTTALRVDSNGGVTGTVLSGENQFGLDSSDYEPKFEVMVRAGVHSRLWLDYFTLDRTGSTTVAQPITFHDVVLQPTDPLQSELDLRLLGLAYGYSVWHGEKLELAPTLEITEVQIAAQAKVATETIHINQTEDIAGPYPTPGLAATWVLSKHFYLDGRAQYLHLDIKDFDGWYGKAELAGLYRFSPNVSFALGYTELRMHLESTKVHESGLFDFDTKGPEIFVRVAF
jgi:hypothetical protein